MTRLGIGLALLLAVAWAPAGADIEVNTTNLQLHFADNGDLLRAKACLPVCAAASLHQVWLEGDPALISFASYATETFEFTRTDGPDGIRLRFEHPANGSYRRWRVPAEGWGLELASRGVSEIIVQSGDSLEPAEAAGFAHWLEQQRYVLLADGDVAQEGLDEPPEARDISDWTGFRNRFWAVMMKPDAPLSARFDGGAELEQPGIRLDIAPEQPANLAFYLGPVESGALRSADPALHGLMYAGIWFWLRWICMGLLWLITLIHGLVPNWALAIMLLSVAVHFLMRPLSRIADRLQDQVHATEAKLAPQLREIQANHKGAEQSERILALYKEAGVHPLYSLKSLAGIAVIIPVFIGAFDMLAENIWLSGQSYLWIKDLARPDAVAELPFDLPFFGSHFNLLPFVMTVLTVLASMLHRHADMDDIQFKKHKRNLALMAAAFLALFYTFPAGMVLYWTTNNAISVVRYGIRRLRAEGA